MLTSVLRLLKTILITPAAIFATMLTGVVSADSHNVYCYDEEVEGYICFNTLKECKNEQKNDLTAESQCYED